MSLKVNIRNFLVFLIFAIYPIIPEYFGIAGISALKLMCLSIVIISAALLGISKLNFSTYKKVSIAFGIWLFIMLLNQILRGNIVEYGYEILCYYLVGLVAIKCLNSRERFIWAIDLLIISAVVASIIGIIESFTSFNVFQLLNTLGADISLQPLRFGFRRIISFTYQTISFCNYCMFALALIFYRITITKKKNLKIKYIIAYIIVLVAAILTLSRSCLLCIIFSQLLLLYLCGYKTFIKIFVLIMICLLIIAGVASLISSDFFDFLQNISYMLLAIFDENYASLLGNIDGTGIGDRADLFDWVWSSVKDYKWLGKGGTAEFSYSYQAYSGIYSYTQTKTSIENQYLNLLYHYGILGLFSMVWVYIQLFVQAIKQAIKGTGSWEQKISFSKLSAVIFFTYLVSFWAVHQIDEKRIFFCTIYLLLAYCANEMYKE